MIVNVAEIHDVNLVTVISEHVELKKKGVDFKGLCPFHNEKTPSFSVSPAKGVWHCFGCGKGGNSPVSFLMELKHLTYPEALEAVAKVGRIEVIRKNETPEEQQKREELRKEKDKLNVALNIAYEEYQKFNEYREKTHGKTFNKETWEHFQLTVVPNKNILANLDDDSVKNSLKELKLVGYSQKGDYDQFRGRLLFPINNKTGKLVGFGGKAQPKKGSKSAKYINSTESLLFYKKDHLFGFYQNRKHIQEAGYAIIVEGYTDVTALYDFGIKNAVAIDGTAISETQARLLKRITKKVLLIGDGDGPGRDMMKKYVKLFLRVGMQIKIGIMPKGTDPYDFVKKAKDPQRAITEFFKTGVEDGLLWRVMQDYDKDDPHTQGETIELAAKLLFLVKNNSTQHLYIEKLSKSKYLGAVKKQLQEALGEEEQKDLKKREEEYTSEQEKDLKYYGIYVQNNRYYNREGYAISNFVINPIMLIVGETSYRVVEVVNTYGHRFIADIETKDLVDLNRLKMVVAGRGNYIFSGKTDDYLKVQKKIYFTDSVYPLYMMGWNKKGGFWTWGDGISYKGEFFPTSDYGVAEVNGTKYYIPANTSINNDLKGDAEIEENEYMKKFIYSPGMACIDFKEWQKLFIGVYGENGKIAILFYIASLFNDIIFSKNKSFPLLDLFGPPGKGKSALAWSIMAMFGTASHAFAIGNGTVTAMYRQLMQIKNGILWIDEYKNDIPAKVIEALKGIYDHTGKDLGDLKNRYHTSQTQINKSAILSGQDLPTADVALFTRCILLMFNYQKTKDSEKLFERLRDIEKTGQLAHITQKLLDNRDRVEKEFALTFDETRSEFNVKLQKNVTATPRIIGNHAVLGAIQKIFKGQLIFDVQDKLVEMIIDQSGKIARSDESATFWRIIAYLVELGELTHGTDILVEETTSIRVKVNRKDTKVVTFSPAKNVLFLRLTKAHPKYLEYHRKQYNTNGFPEETLKYYMELSDNFVGYVKAKRFEKSTYSCIAVTMDEQLIEIPLSKTVMTDCLKCGLPVTKCQCNTDDFKEDHPKKKEGDDLPF